ncbi:MAG: hypothetical protein AAF353_05945 [Pseudomonadota bacterium]
MSFDLSNKKIIMIHGLASKPPRDTTHQLWCKTITENLRVSHPQLAAELEQNPDVFESAYWADCVPHHIPDDAAYCRKLEKQVDKVIHERRKIKDKFHVGMGEKVSGFFKDRGLDLVKLLAGALTVKDDVMTNFLRETELYEQDQYISDQIRAPLEFALRKAWDAGQEPIIVSHSMGTFISYDVLWRFSHRDIDPFKKYRKRRVKMFITMGSPLGDSTVRELLFSHYHKKHGDRQFPTNIDFWHNYACLGDVVSHQKNFGEIFYKPMRTLKLFPKGKKFRSIDYVDLHNPFEVVSHAGNRGREKRNPHKSYGYLAQPRLGSWIADYLLDQLK